MKKLFILGAFILVLFVSAFFIYSNYFQKEINAVCMNKSCFEVEIADTNSERMVGLMDREYLKNETGMLFIFENEDIYPFWMKNTLIPLDIIWINSNLEVVHIERSVPCVTDECIIYTPSEKAIYVLEINAGLADGNNISQGSKVKFKYN